MGLMEQQVKQMGQVERVKQVEQVEQVSRSYPGIQEQLVHFQMD